MTANYSLVLLLPLALLANLHAGGPKDGFNVEPKKDRLTITHSGKPVADFIFQDDKIFRPFFANVRTPGGVQVTRRHPPRSPDATDHDTMHPGIWLGFGDISGFDFWRNRGRIEHVAFSSEPVVKDGRLSFIQECRLKTPANKSLGTLTNALTLSPVGDGYLILWDATFRADEEALILGDQEEMGFGARVATPLTEKAGGVIVNSLGAKTAKATWGKPGLWCDYSGRVDDVPAGITLMPDPTNFRPSWWHNRDYGVFVANPFGRAAMGQGARSAVPVPPGTPLRVRFGAVVHSGERYDPAEAYKQFLNVVK